MNTEQQRERQQFLSAMHAQDIAKLARDTVAIDDNKYDPMQHRINAKENIGLWVMFFSSCLLLTLTVIYL
jgi:hypothetical protein